MPLIFPELMSFPDDDRDRSHEERAEVDGDTIVIGPEIFVSADGSTLCWRGVNYVRVCRTEPAEWAMWRAHNDHVAAEAEVERLREYVERAYAFAGRFMGREGKTVRKADVDEAAALIRDRRAALREEGK